jgi:hypothetical protein
MGLFLQDGAPFYCPWPEAVGAWSVKVSGTSSTQPRRAPPGRSLCFANIPTNVRITHADADSASEDSQLPIVILATRTRMVSPRCRSHTSVVGKDEEPLAVRREASARHSGAGRGRRGFGGVSGREGDPE